MAVSPQFRDLLLTDGAMVAFTHLDLNVLVEATAADAENFEKHLGVLGSRFPEKIREVQSYLPVR